MSSLRTVTILLSLLGLLWIFAPRSEAADGKAMFVEYKCNECHAMAAEGIEVVEAEDAEEEDPFGFGAAEEEEEEEEADDLSNVGSQRDAEWIAAYLKKKVENDDGKKHRKRFKGSDDALRVLSAWLAERKTPVAEP